MNNNINQERAKNYWGITQSPVLAVLGGTRKDKGLDLLLESLNAISKDFALLIAGHECDISIDMIKSLSKNYANKVYIFLNNITDEEFNMAAIASDCIVLPYRKVFGGASGPLTYGVWHEKYIIGPNHGSIGKIINENELGGTFESENVKSLVNAINLFFDHSAINCSKKYLSYKTCLTKDKFINDHINLYQPL